MKLDITRFDRFVADGRLKHGTWGTGRDAEVACAMGAATGLTSVDECIAAGWPRWLTQVVTVFHDSLPRDAQLSSRMSELMHAIAAADARGVDWDDVFRRFRLDSVLPIALSSIGDGDEPWRMQCRAVVQGCIDRGGVTARAAEAAVAAWAAGAAEAAWAAEGAWAAWAAAWLRMHASLIRVLKP